MNASKRRLVYAKKDPSGKIVATSARALPPHYPTRLALKASARAKRALKLYLGEIQQDVRAASSFDDLKQRLLSRFRGFDHRALEKVVTRATVMAELAGRKDLLEEI